MIGKAADKFLKTLDNLEFGSFELVTPDGHVRAFEGRNPGPSSKLILNEWKVLSNLLVRGDSAFADDYRQGLWDTTNLQDLLSLALANDNVIRPYLFGNGFSRIAANLSYMFRANTISGSRKNIHAHYDLGNDFYRLWLDDTMSYSSALYKDASENLITAQNNKYDRILDCMDKKSGSILEVGCGWGGFAERSLRRGDFSYKGITISKQQHEYATQRMDGKGHIAFEDYRHQSGKYDHIVSIEMFEAVGEKFWPIYFGKIQNLLSERGKAIIQTITIRDDLFAGYRKGGDVIRDYIFPGGMLPSPSVFEKQAARFGLKAQNKFEFGQDYAKTLEIWLHNFDSKVDQIKALGFDDSFIRLWRFYLAACIAGFRTGRTNVMQVELSHV